MTHLVYIAGPMRGRPYCNFQAFDIAKCRLLEAGYEPISPADLDRANGFDASLLPEDSDWSNVEQYGFDIAKAMERNHAAILSADAIYLLPGWKNSVGATEEVAIAEAFGLPIWHGVIPMREGA